MGTDHTRDGEADERYTTLKKLTDDSCVASSYEHGCSCTDTEGSESDANTTGPSTNHSHVPLVQLVGGHTLR